MTQKHTAKMTAVFDFDLRAFYDNPHKAVTPFGSPTTLCVGDMLNDPLRKTAPELLELVELVHESFGGGRVITFSDSDVAAFSAAIAKAKGETL